jgi:hypothetical protein
MGSESKDDSPESEDRESEAPESEDPESDGEDILSLRSLKEVLRLD